jgi:GNAT superfamily N-acetyltransferase
VAIAGRSEAALLALLDASLEIELRELARANASAVFRELSDVAWTVGATAGATVYRTALAEDDAAMRIADLSGALSLFGPVTWWAGPTASPASLRVHLAAAGYALEDDEAGMAVDLGNLVEHLPAPSGLRIGDLEGPDGELDPGLLEDYLEVNRRTLDWPPDKVARRRALYRDDERRPRPWRQFVADVSGSAVATSRVLLYQGVAMVHGVATVPEARRQGIGSAVTVAALRFARERGCRIGVLQASSMGQGPYRRIGFRQIAPYGRYVRDAAMDQPAEAEAAAEVSDDQAAA